MLQNKYDYTELNSDINQQPCSKGKTKGTDPEYQKYAPILT